MGLCCYTNYIYAALAVIVAHFGYKYYCSRKKQQVLNQFANTPEDVVIVHGFLRGKRTPNPSPFVMKVETYCRMAGIKYEMDRKNPIGPKGKTPWISLNGEHVSDSNFILKFLNKKFEKNLNGNHSEEDLALANTIRIALEEYIFWGGVLWRFVYGLNNFDKIVHVPVPRWILWFKMGRYIRNCAIAQGLGRHTESEVYELMEDTIMSISKLMGNKKFILGDKPCEHDAGIFGVLSQCVWGIPGCPLERFVEENCSNVKAYCLRMKEEYWPDWEDRLYKP